MPEQKIDKTWHLVIWGSLVQGGGDFVEVAEEALGLGLGLGLGSSPFPSSACPLVSFGF